MGLVPASYLEIIQPLPGDVAGVEDSVSALCVCSTCVHVYQRLQWQSLYRDGGWSKKWPVHACMYVRKVWLKMTFSQSCSFIPITYYVLELFFLFCY